jgi:hypothetical protein
MATATGLQIAPVPVQTQVASVVNHEHPIKPNHGRSRTKCTLRTRKVARAIIVGARDRVRVLMRLVMHSKRDDRTNHQHGETKVDEDRK